eukprot:6506686-Ditylum_brightwellii.AAC.1
MFPQLKQGNLISVGKFCDNGYKAVFLKDTVVIIDLATNDVILTGYQNVAHGNMWMIPLQQQYKAKLPTKMQPKQEKRVEEYSNNVYELKIKRRLYNIFMQHVSGQQIGVGQSNQARPLCNMA